MTKKRRSADRRPAAGPCAASARRPPPERRAAAQRRDEIVGTGAAAPAWTRWRWLALLVPVGLLVLGLTLGDLWNEDFWWDLSSGQAILEARGIPARDPFLYTAGHGSQWVIHSWLWTVLVAVLERLGGLGLVVIGQALIAAAVVAIVYTASRLDRFGLANACWATALVIAAGARLCGKAELATWLLLAVFVRLLERAGPFTWRHGLVLAALFVLWANLHGGYPLGIVAVGCYAAAGILERWRRSRGVDVVAEAGRSAPPLWLVPLLAALALVGPGSWRERLAPPGFRSRGADLPPRGA